MTDPVFLDWRHHQIGKRAGRCRHCGNPALMRDADGKPSHKTCEEGQQTARAGATPAATQTQGSTTEVST